ncbi:unnamed protein product [Lactuca saligna]|uniref:Transposase MuDR plant domain-containing protein n=1 Tax=Lactuca saligna TaxID=75948 RepID=A0AA35ZY74_LACSI|nr:unnamed protein product [Lactuca saligna]
MFDAGLVDEIVPNDFTPLNKVKDDELVNKLCPEGKESEEMDTSEEKENEYVVEHSIFNPQVHWKKQVPILGMRFENPKRLKSMLSNYVVKHGYKLCFEKNDGKRLIVLCCKGACTFML